MLLDGSGYRKFTCEECALLKYAGERIAESLNFGGYPDEFDQFTGVAEFDSMEVDEKLVAIHQVCLRAASTQIPEVRELWCDATLMAMLEALHGAVDINYDLWEDHESAEWMIQDRADLTHHLLRSYLSYHWQPDHAPHLTARQVARLDAVLKKMAKDPGLIPEVSREILIGVIDGYKDAYFDDLDFQTPAGIFDTSPEQFAEISAMMGIDPGYRLASAPSCPPQAVRKAREFFSLPPR